MRVRCAYTSLGVTSTWIKECDVTDSALCRLWLVDRRGCELPRAQLVATATGPPSVRCCQLRSHYGNRVALGQGGPPSRRRRAPRDRFRKATGRRDSPLRPPLWPFVASRSKATTGHPTAMYSATFVKVGEGDEEEEVRTGPDAGVGRYQLFHEDERPASPLDRNGRMTGPTRSGQDGRRQYDAPHRNRRHMPASRSSTSAPSTLASRPTCSRT